MLGCQAQNLVIVRTGTELLETDHYAKDIVTTCLKHLEERFTGLQHEMRKRTLKLKAVQAIANFVADCENEIDWLRDKAVLLWLIYSLVWLIYSAVNK